MVMMRAWTPRSRIVSWSLCRLGPTHPPTMTTLCDCVAQAKASIEAKMKKQEDDALKEAEEAKKAAAEAEAKAAKIAADRKKRTDAWMAEEKKKRATA